MITTRRAIDSCLPRMPRHSSSAARDQSWLVHVASIVFLLVFVCHAASTTGSTNVSTLQASNHVYDMAVDSQGRLLTTDYINSVYRILPNSTRTTLATGLNIPCGITVEVTTNIAYVADSYNHCIMSVSSSGTTTTVAGTCGTSMYGYANGVGTAARFDVPSGIVYYAAGVLYVCDTFNAAIRRINISTTMVTTVVIGTPLYHPNFLCINRAGNTLYVTDYDNYIIVLVDLVPTSTTMTTIAGTSGGYVDGVGSNARFRSLTGITLNNDETMLYIADHGNYRIRSMRLNDSYVGTVAGTGAYGFNDGPAMTAQFSFIVGLKWYCNGTSGACGLLVADADNSRVRVVSLSRYHTITYSTTTSNVTNRFTPSLTAARQATGTAYSDPTDTQAGSRTTSDSLLAPHTYTNTAIVPPPSVVTAVEQLRDRIAASTPVLQYSVSAVSTSAGSIGRMGAVSKIGSCQSPFSPPHGLLSSRIGGCGAPLAASRSVAAEYARGDVVLGMSALLCATALLAVSCYLYSLALCMPLQDGAAALSMPSLLLPLWGAALPTGVGGMVALGRSWEGCVGDGVLLVVGAAVVVALPMALLVVGTMVMLRRLQIVQKVRTATAVKEDVRCAPLQVLRVALEAQWRWQPIPQSTTNMHLYGCVLVLQQRVLWYATMDAAVLVAVSALASAAVDLPLGTCQTLGGAIVALLVLQLLVCGVARPFTTLLDHMVSMTTLALNVVGAALQLSLLSDAAVGVLAVAAALDLLLLGVSGLKAALDFGNLVAAVRRRWGLLNAKHGHDVDDPRKTMSLVVVDVDIPLQVVDEGIPQLLLDTEQELDDDVLESVPGIDDSAPMMSDVVEDGNALTLAYAAMSGELPWDDDDLS